MEALFSEFSYGYALTEELAGGKLGPMIGNPIFPSLYEEGKPGGGHDVQVTLLGAPLFLQFKLSHYLQRSNSSEWSLFGEPYYRVHIRPSMHSNQHSLLLDLEAGNEVYYVAPEFYTAEELSESYGNKTVFENSAFFSPTEIGPLPDDGSHYLVFIRSDSFAYFCSENRRRVKYLSGTVFADRPRFSSRREPRKIEGAFFDSLAKEMLGILNEHYLLTSKRYESFEKQITLRETLVQKAYFAAYLSRAYFDTELFIVQEPG